MRSSNPSAVYRSSCSTAPSAHPGPRPGCNTRDSYGDQAASHANGTFARLCAVRVTLLRRFHGHEGRGPRRRWPWLLGRGCLPPGAVPTGWSRRCPRPRRTDPRGRCPGLRPKSPTLGRSPTTSGRPSGGTSAPRPAGRTCQAACGVIGGCWGDATCAVRLCAPVRPLPGLSRPGARSTLWRIRECRHARGAGTAPTAPTGKPWRPAYWWTGCGARNADTTMSWTRRSRPGACPWTRGLRDRTGTRGKPGPVQQRRD
ncbi:hypothetical protein STENM36S_02695 [Streptomyces tendae]